MLYEVITQEAFQPFRTRRVAQLSQRFRLDLAYALARHVELLADFLERVIGIHLDAEAHAQHLGLPGGEAVQDVLGDELEAGIQGCVRRGQGGLVLDEVV